MRLIAGLKNWKNHYSSTIVTVGNFDGVHLGHQELIRTVCVKSQRLRIPGIVMTFEPHPTKILFPQKDFKSIFELSDRIERIEANLNPDYLVIEPFTRELSELTAEEFYSNLLMRNLHMSHLVVGHDFNFGKDRQGTLEVLRELCKKSKVSLTILEPVKLRGETISSTKIRELINEGDMKRAHGFLGGPFFLRGVVERGAGRGKKMGFPTANLLSKAELFPKNGVYVTETDLGKIRHKSVTNVGLNPTFEGKNAPIVHVETHILNFDQDIYGDSIRVDFLEYLRGEKKFSSVEELMNQIKKDAEKAAKY